MGSLNSRRICTLTMHRTQLNLSIVILSFNRPLHLMESLTRITQQLPESAEVVVVDNPSPNSHKIARIAESFSRVQLIQPEHNLGFCKGMNLGIRLSKGKFVLITEDDILFHPGTLPALLQHISLHPDSSFLSGIILNESSGTVRCAGGKIRLINARYFLSPIDEGQTYCADRYPDSFTVDFLCGAFIFGSRKNWLMLGGFYEWFFMYCEDFDFSMRATALGFKLEIVSNAVVSHVEPGPVVFPLWLQIQRCANDIRLHIIHLDTSDTFWFFGKWVFARLAVQPRQLLRSIAVMVLSLWSLRLDFHHLIHHRAAARKMRRP